MLQQYDQAMRDHIAKHRNLQQRYERIFKADESDVDDEPETDTDDDRLDGDADEERLDGDNSGNGDNGDNGNEPRHLVDQLADLMVEAGSADGEVSREDALRYLLHSERGQALVARMSQHRKRIGKNTMNRSGQLRAVVRKAGGIMSLCKSIAATGKCAVTEDELTQLVVDAVKREHPDLSDAQAFAKVFGAAGPNGEMLRKAIAVAKVAQLEIMPDATQAGDTDVEDDSGKATRQMERLVDEQIRRSPEMTRSQAWNVVVHENPTLAAAAIRRPVANEKMLYPFPR
jgi:hypothetical protein